jgi:hypothetical protein
MKILLLFLLLPFASLAQTKGMKFYGNSGLYLVTYNSSGVATDSVKLEGATLATIQAALGYTPASTAALDAKANALTVSDIGTITQATSKTTTVTLNKLAGKITMNGAALAAAAEVSFTVNNSTVGANDVPVVSVASVGNAGAYLVSVGSVSAGSFTITVSNASAGSLSQAIVLNFIIIKSP